MNKLIKVILDNIIITNLTACSGNVDFDNYSVFHGYYED